MHRYYKLNEFNFPVPCTMEDCDFNHVLRQEEYRGYDISTIFLAVDHDFLNLGIPSLFETMMFDRDEILYQARCCTWDQAWDQHDYAMREVDKLCLERANNPRIPFFPFNRSSYDAEPPKPEPKPEPTTSIGRRRIIID